MSAGRKMARGRRADAIAATNAERAAAGLEPVGQALERPRRSRGRGVAALIPPNGLAALHAAIPPVLSGALELAWAQRDRAVIALEHLEAVVTRIGGYMTPEDQATLREARATLAEHGRLRTEERPEWIDRTPAIVVQK